MEKALVFPEENCDSKIWYYGLFSLISFTDKLMIRKIESIYSYSNIYYLLFLIEIVLIIFGSIELWSNKCIYDYMPDNSKLYTFCVVNYAFQIIITIILTIKIILMNKNKPTFRENLNNFENFETFNNFNEDLEDALVYTLDNDGVETTSVLV